MLIKRSAFHYLPSSTALSRMNGGIMGWPQYCIQLQIKMGSGLSHSHSCYYWPFFKMFSNILCCAGSGHVNPFSCIRNDIFVNVFLYVLSNSDWTMASDHSARRHLVSIEDHDLNSGGFVEVTCRCPYLLPRLAGVMYFMRAGQPWNWPHL